MKQFAAFNQNALLGITLPPYEAKAFHDPC
jgi:hypothetical protein